MKTERLLTCALAALDIRGKTATKVRPKQHVASLLFLSEFWIWFEVGLNPWRYKSYAVIKSRKNCSGFHLYLGLHLFF